MKTYTKQELAIVLELHRKWLAGESDGVRANLSGADLIRADLRDANLIRAELRDANLRDANLRGAGLRGADLRDANLTGANLTGADFRSANLSSAGLTGADLRDANLERANLTGADLRDANLTGANLDFACWPLWCGSLSVKGDEQLVGQLAYHLLDLAKSSGVEVGDCVLLRELANKSNPVIKHSKEEV